MRYKAEKDPKMILLTKLVFNENSIHVVFNFKKKRTLKLRGARHCNLVENMTQREAPQGFRRRIGEMESS